MSDELVERVARAIECSLLTSQLRDAFEHPYTAEARAVIAVLRPIIRAEALEDAARVADEFESDADPDAGTALAAAIRALIKEPKP